MKTLIVDDNAKDRKILRYNLERRGWEVIEARDGREGLELAAIHRPDLIISDALMAGMDGFRFLREIKKSEALESIPFIFYSAVYTGHEEEKLALSLGAAAFIAKPKDSKEFWDELSAILETCGIKERAEPKAEAVRGEDDYLKRYSHIVATKLQEKVNELSDEINRRKQAEAMLRDSEEQYRPLFENNPQPMWVYDLETLRFLAVNDAAVYRYGYSREEFLSMTVKDIRPPEDVPALLENISKVTEGLDLAGTWKHKKKDGTIIDVEITSHTLPFAGKKAEIVLANDVTQRKKAEEAIRQSEERYTTLFESSKDAIYTTLREGLFIDVNQAALDLFGYTREEMIGTDIRNIYVNPEDRPKFQQEIEQRGYIKDYELKFKKKDGAEMNCLLTATLFTDQKGNILGYQGIIRDITERKRMEEKLFQVTQDWEETFNSITDMVTVHDKDWNIIRANKAAEKILGLPFLEKTEDAKCFRYYHGTEKPPEGCPSCSCLQTGKAATFDLFEPHLNMFIEVRAIPRFDSTNELIGLIHVVRDITERKKAEEKLDLLLDEVTKAKTEWEITFDSAMEIIALIDKEFNIIRCNKSFADFCGMPVNTMMGHKFYDLFTLSSGDLEYFREKIQDEEPGEWIETKTTTGKWFYISHRPILDKKGALLFSVIIAADITGLKSAQEKIQESEEALKERVKELERFYEMAVGRELKMKEMKKELKRLNDELLHYRKSGEEGRN